ncbi:hypothetical protein [Nonomuraea sp. SBT364]|uniref:hypothetical protein n=1 Tax=Nonomuraea sp. SBT364 TaxID=1580530 RepID=UPI00066E2DF5|nr:hypothetical protein [Nonomuraea sp. SBT364]
MTHQFARRSGWAMLAAVLTAALLTVYAHSVPGGEFGLTMLAYALWVAPPLVALLVGGLVVTGVPLLARFELSRAALERFADGGRIPGEGEWIGLYPVERAQRHPRRRAAPGDGHRLPRLVGLRLEPRGRAAGPRWGGFLLPPHRVVVFVARKLVNVMNVRSGVEGQACSYLARSVGV